MHCCYLVHFKKVVIFNKLLNKVSVIPHLTLSGNYLKSRGPIVLTTATFWIQPSKTQGENCTFKRAHQIFYVQKARFANII